MKDKGDSSEVSFTRIEKPEDIKKGHWASYCCHLDLWQIETDEELHRAKESLYAWITNTDGPFYGGSFDVWPTKRDALVDLRGTPRHDFLYEEITALLEELDDNEG